MKYQVRYEIRKNDFPKIIRELEQGATDLVQAICFMLVEIADPNTPVETGNLKNAKDIGKDYVHWLAPYAGFVHNGTRYMAARPFIADAVAQVWPIFQQGMKALCQGQQP